MTNSIYKYTYRSLIKPYLKSSPWTDVIFDLSLGIKADQLLTEDESIFLPKMLRKKLEEKRVVSLTPQVTIQTMGKKDIRPLLISTIIGVSLIIISIIDLRRKRLLILIDYPVFITTGVYGFILLICWLCYNHEEMGWNLNLLWLLPTNAVFLYLKFRYYFKVIGIICFTLTLIWFELPQEMNLNILPMFFGLSIRFLTIGRIL